MLTQSPLMHFYLLNYRGKLHNVFIAAIKQLAPIMNLLIRNIALHGHPPPHLGLTGINLPLPSLHTELLPTCISLAFSKSLLLVHLLFVFLQHTNTYTRRNRHVEERYFAQSNNAGRSLQNVALWVLSHKTQLMFYIPYFITCR